MRPEQYNLWIQKHNKPYRGSFLWFFGSIGDDCYIYILFGETINGVLIRYKQSQKWLSCSILEQIYRQIQM